MFLCRICRFDTELDDVVAATGRGTCICLPCLERSAGGPRRMPRTLRRELSAVLAGLEVS